MRRPRTIHEFHPGKIMENRFACWDPWIAASDVTDLYLATNTQLNKKGCTPRLPQLPPRSPASYFDKATLHLGILDDWQAPLCLSKLQMDQLDKRIICSTNHFLSRETYCYLVFDIRNTLPSLGTRIRGLGRWDFPRIPQGGIRQFEMVMLFELRGNPWRNITWWVLKLKLSFPQDVLSLCEKDLSSWWLNQPSWKIWVKMGSSSPNRGEK